MLTVLLNWAADVTQRTGDLSPLDAMAAENLARSTASLIQVRDACLETAKRIEATILVRGK